MARRPGGQSPRGDGSRRARPPRLAPASETSPRHKAAETRPAPASPDPDLVLLGEFGRAHGLNGEIRLKSYTADPVAIASYGPLRTTDGRSIEIVSARPAPGPAPDLLVARVRGVSDRSGAEALNRVGLYVPRRTLGQAEDEDEFFTADLVGLSVVDTDGKKLGNVVSVPNYGGGDLLEIRPEAGGPTALLPFTKAFVPGLDLPGGRITVDPPDDLFAPPGPKPPDEPV
ncbi:ribosome maturation factor RimM [Methylobacterium durans]|uniref:Ribosome maturation factor RimM n=1 Tax=Methylobacterium durans TaxID=2202825 RepID=A0A2U8VZU6_9HYPH|nr:ribosome maturation factor RimM [Methylobacterium durans]AWN39343.1 ribosome maturation factor RimM [Methylobacterium durans]